MRIRLWGDYCNDCAVGYAGDNCDECAVGYFSYPNCRLEHGFVSITAGSFWMGSPQSDTCPAGYPGVCVNEPGNDSYEVLHEVTLTYDFEMSRYEITEAQFEGLMGWNAMDTYDTECVYGCGDDLPIQYISWYDALAYANEMSLAEGLTACYVLSDVECENGGAVGSDYMNCFDDDATFGGLSLPRLPWRVTQQSRRIAKATACLPRQNGSLRSVAGVSIQPFIPAKGMMEPSRISVKIRIPVWIRTWKKSAGIITTTRLMAPCPLGPSRLAARLRMPLACMT